MKNYLSYDYGNSKSIIEYLINKAKNHNSYKHYGPYKYMKKNLFEDRALYLTNGSNWNDTRDRQNFNSSKENSIVRFGNCFSYSREESVAMWMLYGGIKKQGAMVDFTQKAMRNVLETPQLCVGYFEKDNFVELMKLEKGKFDIFLCDVVYYRKQKHGIYIKRADESGFVDRVDAFNDIEYVLKTYPWNYENECRLIVTIDKNELGKYLDRANVVKISLNDIDLGKTMERIYIQPGFIGNNDERFKRSILDGEIEWNLCSKDCKGV